MNTAKPPPSTELEVLARLVVDTAPDGYWPELADLASYLAHDEDSFLGTFEVTGQEAS